MRSKTRVLADGFLSSYSQKGRGDGDDDGRRVRTYLRSREEWKFLE